MAAGRDAVADGGVPPVPRLLAFSSGWAWRLIVVALAAYLLVTEVLDRLTLVVIPLLVALLLSALLHPVNRVVRRLGVHRGLAAGITLLLALALLGGVGAYVVNRAAAQYPQFVTQVSDLVAKAQHWLINGPLHLKPSSVDNIGGKITQYLRARESSIASGAVSAAGTVFEVLTGLILTLFLTFFLLYDGERIWAWLVRFFPDRAGGSVRFAGSQIWRTLTGYVGGTFTVALFHAAAMGTTLAVLGVPLIAPLSLLIFVGSFIPIVGAVVFGGLAVLVALVAKGTVTGLVVLVVLVVENQVESHVLQPLVVGRYVRLHPVAIAVVLTGGAVLAGLPGAIFGVPIVASANAVARALRAGEGPGAGEGGVPPPEPDTSGATDQPAKAAARRR
jgi:predicted PurR-regulated permease PerM